MHHQRDWLSDIQKLGVNQKSRYFWDYKNEVSTIGRDGIF